MFIKITVLFVLLYIQKKTFHMHQNLLKHNVQKIYTIKLSVRYRRDLLQDPQSTLNQRERILLYFVISSSQTSISMTDWLATSLSLQSYREQDTFFSALTVLTHTLKMDSYRKPYAMWNMFLYGNVGHCNVPKMFQILVDIKSHVLDR